MTTPSLPPQGSTSWYVHYTWLDTQARATPPATFTTEQAQDAAAALFTSGTHSGISFAYNDASNRVDATVSGGGSATSIVPAGAGDGITNDTAALAAAISTANTTYNDQVFVDLAGGTYAITGVTLNNYTKLCNGKIVRHSGTSPLLTLPSQGAIQTTQRSVLRDLELDGVTTTSGNVGIAIGFHAAVVLDNVTVRREGTAVSVKGGQFCTAYSVKVWDCGVGLYLTTDVGGTLGGGNSWSWYDLQVVGCTVGLIYYKPVAETAPKHSVYFRNPTVVDSTTTAMAFLNIDDVVIDGSANELTNNPAGATSTTYAGLTIKAASIYAVNSRVAWKNSYVSEATVDPAVILETGSVLSLSDINGYGNSYGEFVRCDDTSSAVLTGSYGCNATVANVRRCSVSLIADRGCLIVPPAVYTAAMGNEWATGQAPTFNDTNGATSSTTGTDTVFGNYVSVTYAASVGSPSSNRVRWAQTFAGTAGMVAFLAQASVATTLDLRIFTSNTNPQLVTLPAGRWVRVVWWGDELLSGSQPLVMSPTDAVGATVKIAKAMLVSGADSPALRTTWNAILGGAYAA